ncbi:MAG TPA: hypothetical protein P5105_03395 [Victivallales bacterium]|nr:hypothetical protein [Victivallales bacterium]HRR06305.1 hypothetical protein [Victivallales bacterium]HRR28288.1 hypothetical protein [Victivallales bacterium]HRU00588.1 hypothetical protein [Victivallales bacterium]
MTIENLISQLFDILLSAKDIELQNFKHGFFAGVITFAILAIILRLIIFLFSSGNKKSRGFKISNESGSIIISAQALSDLVKGVGNSIKNVEVSKVKLIESENDKNLFLEVHLVMGGADTKFGELSAILQQKILDSIKDKFGVDCIKSISVFIDKIVDSKPV